MLSPVSAFFFATRSSWKDLSFEGRRRYLYATEELAASKQIVDDVARRKRDDFEFIRKSKPQPQIWNQIISSVYIETVGDPNRRNKTLLSLVLVLFFLNGEILIYHTETLALFNPSLACRILNLLQQHTTVQSAVSLALFDALVA